MIKELASDYSEYLKVDLTKEVMLQLFNSLFYTFVLCISVFWEQFLM